MKVQKIIVGIFCALQLILLIINIALNASTARIITVTICLLINAICFGFMLAMPTSIKKVTKTITCREKLKQQYPNLVNESFAGGCCACPHHYKYLPRPKYCDYDNLNNCSKCWDRRIKDD